MTINTDGVDTTPATQALFPVTLKERRERLGLTLRDVEEISKGAISNSYLSQLETGKIKNPSLENARTLATIYHCQTDDIAEALSLPILTALLRCHCCGQSLYNAKFITDAAPVQAHSLPGDVGKAEPEKGALLAVERVLGFQIDGPCPICRGVEGCSHSLRERILAALTPSARTCDFNVCDGSGWFTDRVDGECACVCQATPSALSGDAGETSDIEGRLEGYTPPESEQDWDCVRALQTIRNLRLRLAALPSHKGAGE